MRERIKEGRGDTQALSCPLVAAVVPCYNEEEGIQAFYRALNAVLASVPDITYQILFVDDGSEDGTLQILSDIENADTHVRVYGLSRNFGHQVALTAGLDATDADAVICLDADLQHPPSLIPKMLSIWQEGNDIVSAVRRTTAGVSALKRFSSRAFYRLINVLSDTPVVPGTADFFLLSRRGREALCRMPERHRFLRGMISWIGFKRAYVDYDAPARVAGATKYTTRRMVHLAFDAILSFSARPMRLIARLGMSTVALGIVYLLYAVVRYFTVGDLVPGWASLIAVIVVLGGLQLFAIGISGEYLARVFEESKRRPLYFLSRVPQGRVSADASPSKEERAQDGND